jgi:formylglycine-generating enzyme required for sulfatase activity
LANPYHFPKIMIIRLIPFFAALCLLQFAHAAMPGAISFQGRALTATGELMGAGTSVNRTVIFRIWDHSSSLQAANLVYSEQQVVTIAEGEFSALVGTGVATAGTPLGYSEAGKGQQYVTISNAFGGASRYLGVTIDDGTEAVDNEISPRQQIASGAFALLSMESESFLGAITSNMFEDSAVTSNKLAPGAVTSAKISYGAIGTAKIVDAAVTSSKIANGSISDAKLLMPPLVGMAVIPGGTFMMGNSVAGDADITDATPMSTTVSAFYIGVKPVIWGKWEAVWFYADASGYSFDGGVAGKLPNHPVHSISWYDAVKWCNARSQQEGLTPVYYTDTAQTLVYKIGKEELNSDMVKWTANGYRLPTEAEWEFAARGGMSGLRFPWGNTITQNMANYRGDTPLVSYDQGPTGLNLLGSVGGISPATSPAGSFAPNSYGLYDMAGNVSQWCWDRHATPYAGGSDPRGSDTGANRVTRGGNWLESSTFCRVAYRRSELPSLSSDTSMGFRVARSSDQ